MDRLANYRQDWRKNQILCYLLRKYACVSEFLARQHVALAVKSWKLVSVEKYNSLFTLRHGLIMSLLTFWFILLWSSQVCMQFFFSCFGICCCQFCLQKETFRSRDFLGKVRNDRISFDSRLSQIFQYSIYFFFSGYKQINLLYSDNGHEIWNYIAGFFFLF